MNFYTKTTKNYKKLIYQINSFEENIKNRSDSELQHLNNQLKKRIEHSPLDPDILVEAFSLAREASTRSLGLRHYDVQLMAGLTLNDGKIAEMRTGEGKTLAATLPAYYNSLSQKGVHIVTVNDYLARRDQAWMGNIYRFLNLNVGLIQENMNTQDRQKNYGCDITYVTNSEIGFDYLRDNMAYNVNDIVLRPLNYCVLDEIDSILIDEARTPLILSNSVQTSPDKYVVAFEITKYLEINRHFEVDEKNKNIILTEQGILQIQTVLGITDLFNPLDPWASYVINALKANLLFMNKVDYIIQNEEVIIVDEFTGRRMPGRRWNDKLHQAVEAKEGVPIRDDGETIASITYQSFFALYPKLSGMTGTAKTAEAEFEKIYNLKVDEIPTAKKNLRNDLTDLIYKDELSKWKAVAKKCKEIFITGQPILIGTTSIEKSEILSQLLEDYQLPHQILNAKPENVRKEAAIIARAGKFKSITIATNMAGRGTDIVLGGCLDFEVQKQFYDLVMFFKTIPSISLDINWIKNNIRWMNMLGIENFLQNFTNISNEITSLQKQKAFTNLTDIEFLKVINNIENNTILTQDYLRLIVRTFNIITYSVRLQQEKENTLVKQLGGLYVIGTERNDSRRIDNQLRGRCGRQGDPGVSRFFLSLDDYLLRLFGGNLQKFMDTQLPDDIPLESGLINKTLNSAQQKLEEYHYDIRKNLFEYDEVLTKQRKIIFSERCEILNSICLRNTLIRFADRLIQEIIDEIDILETNKLSVWVENIFGFRNSYNLKQFKSLQANQLKIELEKYLFTKFWLQYDLKQAEIETAEPGIVRDIERNIILRYIDSVWKEHLQKMALLREDVNWRSYGQRNPLFEYKDDAYILFLDLIKTIRQLVIFDLLTMKLI